MHRAPPIDLYVTVAGDHSTGWEDWFEGLRVSGHGQGTTTVRGRVADQAAVHGVLATVRDLGLPLLSVTCVPADAEATGERPEPIEQYDDATGTRPQGGT